MTDIKEEMSKRVRRKDDEIVELLNVIAKQNEDLIDIQNNKIDILCAIDARDELVMKMYKRKNLWAGVFGVIGLSLTLVSTMLVAFGLYFLPAETRLLFDELMIMVGIV